MKDSILVDIVMVTYNQENYISKAIESVIFQNKWSSCKLIIGDDCSTDNTLEICKKYALNYPDNIILLNNPINIGIIKNYLNCFKYCTGKYIAILEGDDFWTDQLKLQKQLEIMENDENIGLVHTNYKILDNQDNVLSSLPMKLLEKTANFIGFVYPDIINQNFICSVTVMFKRDILDQIDFSPFVINNCKTIDLIIWLQCSIKYKFAFLSDSTSVWRVSPNSISNNIDFKKIEAFSETKYYIKNYYLNKHNPEGLNISEIKEKKDVFLLYKAVVSKDFKNSLKYLKRFTIKGFLGCIKDWETYN